MSYILDALRKSELQRRLKHKLVYKDASPASAASNLLSGFTVAAGLALVLALGGVGWLLWGEPASVAPALPVATPAPLTADEPPAVPAAQSAPASVAGDVTSPAAIVPDLTKPLAQPSRPSAPTPARTPITTASREPSGRDAPWLADLSAEFRAQLPPLAVNIHVYVPDEAQRILYINNHPYHRGDPISDGVVVEEIVEDGVVLRYQQQRFKLPRPR